jgi:outer membrane protein assembly factor BamB
MRKILLSVSLFGAAFSLSGCDLFDARKGPPLTGKRISLFDGASPLTHLKAQQKPTGWIKPNQSQSWLMPGGNSAHLPCPTQMTSCPELLWSVNLEGEFPIISTPVIDREQLFILSSDGVVSCFCLKSGACIWKTQVGSASLGGGVSLDGKGKVFVTSGSAELKALDTKNGKILWSSKLSHPTHQAPVYAQDRVFCLNTQNQLEVFDSCKGSFLWDQRGTPKELSFLGGSAPAVDQQDVIVGYSAKEISSLNIRSGDPAWFLNDQDSFFDALQKIGDIHALPIIDSHRVYLFTSENFSCLDRKTGNCIWKKPFAGTQTPLVLNHTIYLITNHNQILALDKSSGEILWEKKMSCEAQISAFGPIAAGERLYSVLSDGQLCAIDPSQKGKIVWETFLKEKINLPPVAGCGFLCIITHSGKLLVFGKKR